MDDFETKHRRARLRELVDACFDGKTINVIRHIESRTGKRPNQGELSAIQKDDGKSFADKKAKTLTEQIGLHRRWFDFPMGSCVAQEDWKKDPIISNFDTSLSPLGNTKAPMIGAESTLDDQGGKMPKLASVSTLKPNLDYVRFEIYDVRMSAGPGAAQIDRADVVEYLPVLKTWAQENLGTANQDRIKLVTCSGISMQPTIDDGALMFVDIKVREFRGDGLYCLAWNRDLIVKRLIADVIGGTLRIVSDNPDKDNYKDVVVRPEEMDQITILGQVKRWFKTCKP